MGKSDALRFHYLCVLHSKEIQILRFAMVPYCLQCLAFAFLCYCFRLPSIVSSYRVLMVFLIFIICLLDSELILKKIMI